MQNDSRFVLRKAPQQSCCRTFKPWNSRRKHPSKKPWPNTKTNVPPRLSSQITKKQRLHKKPSVAEDNEERKTVWTNSKKQQESDGKRMIQRLNEENGRQENTVLSTWSWCEQGWPQLSQTTDRWPRPCSLLLTVLNKYLLTSFKHMRLWLL